MVSKKSRPSNEGRCCDAVIRILEGERSSLRQNAIHHPKGSAKTTPDIKFEIGDHTFVGEHTLIQSFPKQIAFDQTFDRFSKQLLASLSDCGPTSGAFRLLLPFNVGKHVAKDATETCSAIKSWVSETMPLLLSEFHSAQEKRPSARHGEFTRKSAATKEIPFVLMLQYFPLDRPIEKIAILRLAPSDIEPKRVKSLTNSVEEKFASLNNWKREGIETFLVLEDQDISLSNATVVFDALRAAMHNRDDRPDRIFFVETIIDEWAVYEYRDDYSWQLTAKFFPSGELLDWDNWKPPPNKGH